MTLHPEQLKQPEQKSPDMLVVLIAYAGFIALGMPGAMLNIAWSPYMRESFQLPLDAVGTLFVSTTMGYFLGSFLSGRLMSRFQPALLLTLSSLVSAAGLFGYTLAPQWWLLVACGLPTGIAGGIIDAGMNIYFAAHFSSRLMNWLHASFGVGATLAPFLMTEILRRGGEWRTGYHVIVVLYVVVALVFFVSRKRWLELPQGVNASGIKVRAKARETLRLPVVWAGIVLFATYAGLEAGTGQWAFALFNQSRGVDELTAGQWVSLYWGSFTIGRIIFGGIASRFDTIWLIRGCIFFTFVGEFMLWWNPVNSVGFIGLALAGFAQAPVFPLLVTATQNRLGAFHAPNAIGFQVSAAGLGIGVLPGLMGIIGRVVDVEAIPLFLTLIALVIFVLHEVVASPRWTAKKEKPKVQYS